MKKKRPKRCQQHHQRKHFARGRCKSCYYSIKRWMKGQNLTLADAIALGYFLA